MIASQREAIILDFLSFKGVVTVDEIARFCGCSAMSVRRDLRHLEDRGLIRRTHGGAAAVEETRRSPAAPSEGVIQARAALVDRTDALIVTPIRTAAFDLLVSRARRAGIPIVAESVFFPGATTCVSIDDFDGGTALGRWTGTELAKRGSDASDIIVLDVTTSLANTAARSKGFAEGLRDTLGKGFSIIRVDGQGLRKAVTQVVTDALAANPAINVIFGINDDSALGALDSWRASGRADEDLFLVSMGLEGQRSRELLCRCCAFKAAVAMFPELVGRVCVDAAVCAYHKCALPERLILPYAIVTPNTLDEYYECPCEGGEWKLKPAALQKLVGGSVGAALLYECNDSRRPARIGYLQVLSTHDWYQTVRRAMQERSQSLNIRLEVIDTSHDLDAELEYVDRMIGRTAAQLVEEGDSIILDSGPATPYLAEHLRGYKDLTVITNALDVANRLSDEPGVHLLVAGGVFRRESRCTVGPAAEATFRGLRASKAFLTCTGFSLSFGLSTNSTTEASVKRLMLEAGREITLLANHTAIGAEALVQIAPFGSVHRLITDAGISPHDRLALTQRGLEVIISEAEGKEGSAE